MNLAQYHKDAIVRSILNDIPKTEHRMAVAEMQAALYAAMTADERRVFRKNPKALACKTLYRIDYALDHQIEVRCGSVDVEEVLKPWREKAKARSEMESKLHAALKSIRTRKQFVDKFPEFIKYAPDEHGTCATLPAVANVVADLLKLGWTTKVSRGAA